MADRELLLERLERLAIVLDEFMPQCAELVRYAIALLKEQEAKPMTEYDDGWDCPRCGLKLVGKTASGYPCDEFDLPDDEIVKYCPVCGQAVKWE